MKFVGSRIFQDKEIIVLLTRNPNQTRKHRSCSLRVLKRQYFSLRLLIQTTKLPSCSLEIQIRPKKKRVCSLGVLNYQYFLLGQIIKSTKLPSCSLKIQIRSEKIDLAHKEFMMSKKSSIFLTRTANLVNKKLILLTSRIT